MSKFKPSASLAARPASVSSAPALPRNPAPPPASPPVAVRVSPATPVEPIVNRNFLHIIGFGALVLYVFSLASFLNETFIARFGIKPYLTMITGPVVVLALAASGSILLGLRSKIGVFWGLYLACMLVGAPLSVWKS